MAHDAISGLGPVGMLVWLLLALTSGAIGILVGVRISRRLRGYLTLRGLPAWVTRPAAVSLGLTIGGVTGIVVMAVLYVAANFVGIWFQ